jgi:hypothetical protein
VSLTYRQEKWLAITVAVVASPFALAAMVSDSPMSGMIGMAFVVCFIVGVWVLPPLFARNMMLAKGRSGGAGVALGLLIGWIGVLIVACLSHDQYALQRGEG